MQVIGSDYSIENAAVVKEAFEPVVTSEVRDKSNKSFIGCESLTNNTAEGTFRKILD